MPNSNITPLRPQNPIPFTVPAAVGDLVPLDDLVKDLPEFLEYVISCILEDFDYDANPTASTAVAVRILAVCADDRLTTALLENTPV